MQTDWSIRIKRIAELLKQEKASNRRVNALTAVIKLKPGQNIRISLMILLYWFNLQRGIHHLMIS